ncbi:MULTISPECIES: SDR family NAD(P)-dependent oxidoreductase [unclassified Chelatococcus]|uniref:SDR family NAD(P)-dependent oxidoreductase n=1 Tax=unclassified Chelatococcus TaxID=2638111 RepID=UPI0020C0C0A8|nr:MULTISPECIES: SDR family NAD(P)-dependent oxidoreductase [unclassified Chelatococcus]MCO5074575.1 SDR family NAD(P)-dependent oxidoreductase [Chelatococcus sp.]CAH1650124.1 NADP-dependent 3-hydroxy acid dehydrogenase YdfG [Hyphomicrobiales bacterium]CAH1692439.1 NADP-dependent 3-hydroxy acid dehydrogenase YdfG [Hyphomicrobiales bacterium]
MSIALITGASRGIGRAIALELRRHGFSIALAVRDPSRIPDELVGENTAVFVYDAEKGGEKALVDAVVARFGGLDALVLNAGILGHVGLEAEDEAAENAMLDALLDINVKAPFRLARAAFPILKQSGRGRVVTVASLSGKRVMGLNVGYQMSKHAVMALNHAIRRAGWEHGIRAVALCPGYVSTEMTSDVSSVAPDEMIQAEDLARLVGTIVTLPNTAAVAELLVNCRYEHAL